MVIMVQNFLTNSNNDLYIAPNGNLAIGQGVAAVEAACASISKVSLGEECLSTVSGLPFFQSVFVGVPNLAVFNSALRAALLSVSGVAQVTGLTSSVGKNTDGQTVFSYKATIESIYGQTFTISQESPAP